MGDTNEQKQNGTANAKSKLPIILAGAGAAVVALLLLVIVLVVVMVNAGKTINLNKYASINVTGYNTVGTAQIDFDYEQFKEDYGNKIKFKSKDENTSFMSMFYSSPADCLIGEYVDGSFDKNSQISNGDEIVYKWDCDDEEIKKLFGYKVKYKDLKLTVKGLEEVATFDPFEGVELIYTGIAPNGSAEVKNNSTAPYASRLSFQMDVRDGLSNGDVVTVTVYDGGSQNPMQYFINAFDAIPSTTEKQFTVDGLGSYADSAAQIPADTLEKMKSQANDLINAYVANNWNSGSRMDSCNYIGNYFLTAKNAQSYGDYSNIILVYEIQITIDNQDRNILDSFTFYTAVTYTDPILLPDGTCSIDLSRGSLASNTFSKQYPGGWFGYTYTIKGYEDLDTLQNKLVTTQIDRYSYENNISQ
ncbi:MAG: hypothetical protein K2H41_10485 [Acetatifactor sp.]|nr:hypothetical protein [Acetatifactor sp.]MDE7114122.1 hypothetical protein [Acetatifactor sp.]